MISRLPRRRALGLIALALFSPSAVLAHSVAPSVDSEQFDDWTLVCDNGRRCTAVGLPTQTVRSHEPELYEGAILTIVRDPQAQARVKVEILLSDWEDFHLGSRWTLIDASGKLIISATSVQVIPAARALRIRLPPTSLATLLGKTDEVALATSGKPAIALSLVGMKAALMRLDEVQGRSGGVTATVSKGPRPASAIPAPPTLPLVIQAPPSRAPAPRLKPPGVLVALSKQLSELEVCDGMGGSPAAAVTGPQRLDDKTILWTIWCSMGDVKGLHQPYVPVLSASDGRNVRLAPFEGDDRPASPRSIMKARTKEEAENLSIPILLSPEFDPRTGVLDEEDESVSLSYSQGSFDRYIWTGRALARFEAKTVSVPFAGDVANSVPYFKIWPPYYRAIVRPIKTTRRIVTPAAPPH
ncbi:DUF1176 domain-containing protein [Caulobacter sp. LARHSG274]